MSRVRYLFYEFLKFKTFVFIIIFVAARYMFEETIANIIPNCMYATCTAVHVCMVYIIIIIYLRIKMVWAF